MVFVRGLIGLSNPPCILDAEERNEIPGYPVLTHNTRLCAARTLQPESLSAKVIALKSAEALLIVSKYSAAGTESATMPAPAWM